MAKFRPPPPRGRLASTGSTTSTTEDPVIAKMLQAMGGGAPPPPSAGNPHEIYLDTGSRADPNDPTPIPNGQPFPPGYKPAPPTLWEQLMEKYPRLTGGEADLLSKQGSRSVAETQAKRIQKTRTKPSHEIRMKDTASLMGAIRRRLGL